MTAVDQQTLDIGDLAPGHHQPAPAHTGIGEPVVTITVHGHPAPQGSKSAFRNQHTGRIQQVESSKRVKPWRQDVKHAALDTIDNLPGWTPLDGPLAVAMTFTFARPKGHWRTGRNAHLLRPSAPARPHGIPDLSKLARSTEDALTGIVWADDARIVTEQLAKHYAASPDVDVLDRPGAVIHVWRLPATLADHHLCTCKEPPRDRQPSPGRT